MWIVFQIGGREHYAIPRGLHAAGHLAALFTDFWVPPGAPTGCLPGARRLGDRFHPDLREARVEAPNLRMLAFEALARLCPRPTWETVISRNNLFQHRALQFLKRFAPPERKRNEPITVFSYSYAAQEIFRKAKRRGWQTVLGQIDPGPGEDAIVRKLRHENPAWAGAAEASPPATYWDAWREECELADRIVVNSPWSRDLLLLEGIAASKLEIIPLAQATAGPAPDSPPFPRSQEGPLRFLFLGQAIVRKGIHDVVEAARLLGNGPWQIDVVGAHGALPDPLPLCLNFHGQVPRSQASAWYARSDVFLLPTHSDGFALTQLEAMAQGLPVIATRCCGEVVTDRINGWIIPEGNPAALADTLRQISLNRLAIPAMGAAARKTASTFTLESITQALLSGKSG